MISWGQALMISYTTKLNIKVADQINSRTSSRCYTEDILRYKSLGTEKINKMCQVDRGKTLRFHEQPSGPTLNDFTVASWYEARNRVVYHAYMKMPWRVINDVIAICKRSTMNERKGNNDTIIDKVIDTSRYTYIKVE